VERFFVRNCDKQKEQFQEKCGAIFRPELRPAKKQFQEKRGKRFPSAHHASRTIACILPGRRTALVSGILPAEIAIAGARGKTLLPGVETASSQTAALEQTPFMFPRLARSGGEEQNQGRQNPDHQKSHLDLLSCNSRTIARARPETAMENLKIVGTIARCMTVRKPFRDGAAFWRGQFNSAIHSRPGIVYDFASSD
jgi:hypothetical protein